MHINKERKLAMTNMGGGTGTGDGSTRSVSNNGVRMVIEGVSAVSLGLVLKEVIRNTSSDPNPWVRAAVGIAIVADAVLFVDCLRRGLKDIKTDISEILGRH